MRVWYIKESEEALKLFQKFILNLKCFFGIIKIEIVSDKIICTLPITNNLKLTDKKIIKIFKSLNKKLYKFNIPNIVLSSFLGQIDLLKNKLYSEEINIIDGRLLFNYLIYDVIIYIANKIEIDSSDLEVSFLTNDDANIVFENIKLISRNIKSLNIVTNHMEKFKKLQDYLYEELGIMIKVSNNKRKALSKTNIIINIDFPSELINKYSIPDNCIIVNINGNININSKKFNGININGYKLRVKEEYKMKGFAEEAIYESLVYGKMRRNYKNKRNNFKKWNKN